MRTHASNASSPSSERTVIPKRPFGAFSIFPSRRSHRAQRRGIIGVLLAARPSQPGNLRDGRGR